jgi:hypothetical protein
MSEIKVINHHEEYKESFNLAFEALKKAFKSNSERRQAYAAFSNFFFAFSHLVRWTICGIRKNTIEESISNIGGIAFSIILMFFTGILSVVLMVLYAIRDILELNLWQVAKGGMKLGVIAILVLAMWNWKQSLHVTWNVSRSIASAYAAGSDSSKKLAISPEIGRLLKQKKELEKPAGEDIDFAFLDTPTPELLQAQIGDARVSFKDLRKGVEKADLVIALALELMKQNDGSTSLEEDWKAAEDKTDGLCYQKAHDSMIRLKNRIDVIDAQHEAESFRSILSNLFSW